MKLWNQKKLLGAVGLSAIALISGAKPADAANVLLGSDYFESPSGQSTFIFDPAALGLPGAPFGVPLQGRPIPGFPRSTDTVVQRQRDAVFDDNGDGFLERTSVTIPIEMTQLSLESLNPINGYNVFVSLDPNQRTTGEMTIRHNFTNQGNQLAFDDSGPIQGTFDSYLNVFYKAELTPIGGGQGLTIFDNFRLDQIGATWTHKPNGVLVRGEIGDQDANCHTLNGPGCLDGDFFAVGGVIHQKGSPTFPQGHTTVVTPCPPGRRCDFIKKPDGGFQEVPEPMTIFGSGLALGFGMLFQKNFSRKLKKQPAS